MIAPSSSTLASASATEGVVHHKFEDAQQQSQTLLDQSIAQYPNLYK